MAKKKELQKKIEELQELKIGIDKAKQEPENESQPKEPKAKKDPTPEADPIPDEIVDDMMEEESKKVNEPKVTEEHEVTGESEVKEPESTGEPDESTEESEANDDEETKNKLDYNLGIDEQVEQARKRVARMKPATFDGFCEDGPHKAYKYWNYKGRFWVLTEDFWFASEHGLWRPIWVWYQNGEIHHLMTEEEKQKYLP